MSEDYFNEDKNTIFEDKKTLFLDYKDWGILIEDVHTLTLYENKKCLQKYKDQLYTIIELMKLNDYTHYTEKNAIYIDDYLLLIYDLYNVCNNYVYDLHKNVILTFICPFDKYNEFIISDEIKLYEHLLYLSYLNKHKDFTSLKSYYSFLKYIDFCIDKLNIEKQNIPNYNTFYKTLSERYINLYNIVVKKQIYCNCKIDKYINYFDDDVNIYDILIYIINICNQDNIKEINNIKDYYISKIKSESNILLRQRYDMIINVCEQCFNIVKENHKCDFEDIFEDDFMN